jgi:hypothetical protein
MPERVDAQKTQVIFRTQDPYGHLSQGHPPGTPVQLFDAPVLQVGATLVQVHGARRGIGMAEDLLRYGILLRPKVQVNIGIVRPQTDLRIEAGRRPTLAQEGFHTDRTETLEDLPDVGILHGGPDDVEAIRPIQPTGRRRGP